MEQEHSRFEELSWSLGRPGTVYLLGLLGLLGLFIYDYTVVHVYLVPAWEWDVTRSDWLFGLSLWTLGYLAVGPLTLTSSALPDDLRERPVMLCCLGWLGVFFLLGTVGNGLLPAPTIDFLHAHQPPVFASVSADRVTECLGPVVDGRCHGSWAAPLGTDGYGYDVTQSLVMGAHVSLYVAVITAAFIVPIGVTVGAVSGFYGGVLDTVLMRYVDVQQTIPAVVVYILLILVLEKSVFAIVVVFGLFSWGGIARVVRGEVLQRRNAEYVVAARNAGGTEQYALRRHVLPNISHSIVTVLTNQIPVLLVTEAAIAYLNLGDPDLLSWGTLVARGLPSAEAGLAAQWWVSGTGVLALSTTVVSIKLLGDGVRDLLDPGGE